MSFKHAKIFLVAFVYFLFVPSDSIGQVVDNEQKVKASLRMVGHQVLLNSGDVSSLVLPIEKVGDQYIVKFDAEFQFDPEKLVVSINETLEASDLDQNYIVEVEECASGDIVYSYQKTAVADSSLIPCATRIPPKGCYSIRFTVLKSSEVVMCIDDSKSKDESSNALVIILLLVPLVGFIVFFVFWIRKPKVNPNLIVLGMYHFDTRKAELILKEQRIELTSKEADLLMLLYKTVNKTVERELILNLVWGDEGDYVGRTLDVFISKLRKKLEADPSIKIVNIRGVGYKLVMDV
ncbi:MAG: DNA-binding response OmpR family regulator [Salibacteraceae bacterium]|jgi:DNA-binding response OmpR family regulator